MIDDRIDRADLSGPFIRFFFGAFCLVLAGYALFNKGFAYAGVAPIFIGEMALFTGVIAALSTRTLRPVLLSSPGLALLPLIAWTVVETIPYVGLYKIDALRDSVINLYAAFAFIVAAVLLHYPPRLNLLIAWYGKLIPYAVAGITAIFLLVFVTKLPMTDLVWPGSDQRLLQVKAGDNLVQLTGMIVFGIIGLRSYSLLLKVAMIGCFMLNAAMNRGGTTAALVAILLALYFGSKTPRFGQTVVKLLALCIAIGAVITVFPIALEANRFAARDVSIEQITHNFASIIGAGDEADDATRRWRLEWWQMIWDYTVAGPYFWTGKGFGINLADSDGFQVSDIDEALLRSPHSAAMTILARTGVPGLVLWFVALATWLITILKALRDARIYRDNTWYRFFAFVLCWWIAFLVNAMFDVALEGPMAGIWFWSLHGIGIAAVIIHRERRR